MDARLTTISNFTPTKHSSVPSDLDPSLTTLPPNYTVCIIGASQGIGEHIAYAYALARATNIVISSRTLLDLQRVASRITELTTTSSFPSSHHTVNVECRVCDISSSASVSSLAEFASSKFTRLDALICNAAYPGPVVLRMHEGHPEWVQQAFDVNAVGTYLAAHYFVPLLLRPLPSSHSASSSSAPPDSSSSEPPAPASSMEERHSARLFITVGTLASLVRRGPIANTGYCVSKFAQARLVELLAEQYTDQGLLPINIHPGAVATESAARDAPREFVPYLTDSPSLCGAVLVRLSHDREAWKWLAGRLISATWDLQELEERKGEIERGDLLKFALLG